MACAPCRVDERQDVRRCPRNRDHGGVCVSEWISDHRRGLVDVSIIPRLTRYEVCAFNGVYADCYYRYFSGFVVRFPPPKTVRLRFICALPDFLKIRSGEVPELVYIVARKQHILGFHFMGKYL